MSVLREDILVRLDALARIVDGYIGLGRYGGRPEKRDIAERCITLLCERYGGRFRFSGGAYSLSVNGVRASCTEGEYQLLRGWVRAARRKIATARAGER